MHAFLHALLHYTGGDNGSGSWYLELSGSVADIVLVGGGIQLIRKHTCHVNGCWRVITSIDPDVHAPACRKHHSHRALQGLPPEHPERRKQLRLKGLSHE